MNHAMTILSWMEMPEEDQPPEHIWLNEDQLEDHFERIRRRYQNKASGMEEVPGQELQSNEYVDSLLK